jgi:hypothetical protein
VKYQAASGEYKKTKKILGLNENVKLETDLEKYQADSLDYYPFVKI